MTLITQFIYIFKQYYYCIFLDFCEKRIKIHIFSKIVKYECIYCEFWQALITLITSYNTFTYVPRKKAFKKAHKKLTEKARNREINNSRKA